MSPVTGIQIIDHPGEVGHGQVYQYLYSVHHYILLQAPIVLAHFRFNFSFSDNFYDAERGNGPTSCPHIRTTLLCLPATA